MINYSVLFTQAETKRMLFKKRKRNKEKESDCLQHKKQVPLFLIPIN